MKLRSVVLTLAFALTAPFLPGQALQKTTTPPATASSRHATAANLLDINTASPDQLAQLPGIGVAYSKRIVDGRPYANKTQLTSKGIIPQKTYDGIKDQIIARQAAKPTK